MKGPEPTGWISFLEAVEARHTPVDLTPLRRAQELILSKVQAGEQERHGLSLAQIINHLGGDAETLAAGLLLPWTDEGSIGPGSLEKAVGTGVARLIQGATRIAVLKEYHKHDAEPDQVNRLRKMLLTMAEDPRVVLLRLADQLDRLRRYKALAEGARRGLGRETLNIFAPLAGRLGIWQVKWELEDLAFRALEPETYQRIAQWLDQRRSERERFIQTVIARLKDELHKAGIQGEVTGRAKHIYSIWNKMRKKGVDFYRLSDVLAFRILVKDVADCYAALSLVHNLWQPIPEEFDDYIAKPKPNRYRSLHTAVTGPEDRTMEVQIRTQEMHRHAELGVAAHWRYKESAGRDVAGIKDRIAWLRGFLESPDEGAASPDLIERFKAEAFHDRIYVLTPQGRVVDLPVGATPLDFAYAVHTEIGHRCRGAKVDGVMVQLTQALTSGQQVEILTAREGAPSRDWLNPARGFLKSESARAKVRHWFKEQDYDKHVAQGRDILDRERKRVGIGEVNLGNLARHFEFKRQEDFLAAVGRGHISPGQLDHALRLSLPPRTSGPAEGIPHAPPPPVQRGGMEVLGVSNLLTHMAGCCKPVPNDPIAGYITQGQGIAIHRRDCANLIRLTAAQPHRIVDVTWGGKAGEAYLTDILIEANDRRGLLRDVSEAVTSEQVNILAVNTLTDRLTLTARMTLTLEITSAEQLERVLHRVARVPDVVKAQRKV
jgi:GTP pyrophosphokinase